MKKIFFILIVGITYSQWFYPTTTPYDQGPGTAMCYGNPILPDFSPLKNYGKLYVLFGHQYVSGEGLKFYSLDCSTLVWETLPSLPTRQPFIATYGTSICYFAKDDLELIFCILGRDPLVPRQRNEFWLYDVRGRRWYNLPDVPGDEPIGYGSDIVTGEIVKSPLGPYEYVKIYISKGVLNQWDTAYGFLAYHFCLPSNNENIESLIGLSYFQTLPSFPHGSNSRMTFNPSFFIAPVPGYTKEIYALCGLSRYNMAILRYDIPSNTWNFLTDIPWNSLDNPSIGMFGVIGNRKVPGPFQDSSYFHVLRGNNTNDIKAYWVDKGTWIDIIKPDTNVTYGKIVYGLGPLPTGEFKEGMWAFFGGRVVGFLPGLGRQ
jgi:hypothetical protein